jgi:hypothetical protein
MSKEIAYTKEEVELATKIANALINEESNAYIVHLTKKLDALKKDRLKKML